MTLLAEHAPKERRGFFCSFAQTGVQIGLVLGTLSFLLVGLLPDDQLNAWGWRVPFLLGFVMIAVALWVRLRVEESPVFQKVQESHEGRQAPDQGRARQLPAQRARRVSARTSATRRPPTCTRPSPSPSPSTSST